MHAATMPVKLQALVHEILQLMDSFSLEFRREKVCNRQIYRAFLL